MSRINSPPRNVNNLPADFLVQAQAALPKLPLSMIAKQQRGLYVEHLKERNNQKTMNYINNLVKNNEKDIETIKNDDENTLGILYKEEIHFKSNNYSHTKLMLGLFLRNNELVISSMIIEDSNYDDVLIAMVITLNETPDIEVGGSYIESIFASSLHTNIRKTNMFKKLSNFLINFGSNLWNKESLVHKDVIFRIQNNFKNSNTMIVNFLKYFKKFNSTIQQIIKGELQINGIQDKPELIGMLKETIRRYEDKKFRVYNPITINDRSLNINSPNSRSNSKSNSRSNSRSNSKKNSLSPRTKETLEALRPGGRLSTITKKEKEEMNTNMGNANSFNQKVKKSINTLGNTTLNNNTKTNNQRFLNSLPKSYKIYGPHSIPPMSSHRPQKTPTKKKENTYSQKTKKNNSKDIN